MRSGGAVGQRNIENSSCFCENIRSFGRTLLYFATLRTEFRRDHQRFRCRARVELCTWYGENREYRKKDGFRHAPCLIAVFGKPCLPTSFSKRFYRSVKSDGRIDFYPRVEARPRENGYQPRVAKIPDRVRRLGMPIKVACPFPP